MKKALLLLIPVGILFSSCSCSNSEGGGGGGGGGGEDIPIIDPEELIHATAVSGDPTHPFYLKVGEQKKIKATLSPSPTLDTEKTFTWSNSNSAAVVYTIGEKTNELTLLGKKAGKSTLVATNEFNPLLKREFNVEVIDYDEESMYLWQYDSEDRKQFGYDSKENKLGNKEGTAILNGMEWNFTRSNLSSLQSGGGAIGFGKGSAPETHVHLENTNYRPIKSIVIEAASAKAQGKLTLKVGETEVLSNFAIPETDYNDHIQKIRAENLDFLQGNISIDFDTPEYDPSQAEDPTYRAPGAVQLKSIWIQYGEDTNEYVNTETFDFEEMMKDEDFLARLKSSMTPLTIESEDSEYVIEFAAARKPGKDDKIQDLLLANSDIRITTKNPDRRLGKVEFDSQLGGSKSKYALSSSILGGEPYNTSLAKVTDGQLKYSIFAPYVDSVKFSNSNSYSSGIRKITVKSVAGKHATLSGIEEITGEPAVKEYHVGGTFNPEGLNSVVAHFEEEDVNDILVPANLFTWFDGTSYPEELTTELQVGTTSVVGVYKGKEVHVEGIEVKDFDHLIVEKNDEKFKGDYLETQTVKKDGLKIFAVAGNAEPLDVTSKVTFYDGATYNTEKSKYLTKESEFAIGEYINDGGETLTCQVDINVYEIDKIEAVEIVPKTAKYLEGQSFKSTNIVVNGSKEGADVEPINVASKMTWLDGVTGEKELSAGTTVVKGTYGSLDTVIEIPDIVVQSIERIVAEGTLNKTNYIEGDEFSYSGVSIKGYGQDDTIQPKTLTSDSKFYDGATFAVNEDDEIIYSQKKLTLASTDVVCVWNNKRIRIGGIRVLPVRELEVTTQPKKVVYGQGEYFSSTGMVITGTSEDGSASKPISNLDFVFYDANLYDPAETDEKKLEKMKELQEGTTSVIGVNKNDHSLRVTITGLTIYKFDHLELVKKDETKDLYPLEYLEGTKFNSENVEVYGVYPVESGLERRKITTNAKFYDKQAYEAGATVYYLPILQRGTDKVVVYNGDARYSKGTTLEIDVTVYQVNKVRVDKTNMKTDYLHYAELEVSEAKSGLKFYGYNVDHPTIGEINISNGSFDLYDGPSFKTEKPSKRVNLDTTYMVAKPVKDCKYDLEPFEIDGIVVHPIKRIEVDDSELVRSSYAEDDTFSATGLVMKAFGELDEYGSVDLSSSYFKFYNGPTYQAAIEAAEDPQTKLTTDNPAYVVGVYTGGELDVENIVVNLTVLPFTHFVKDESGLQYKKYVEGDTFDYHGLSILGLTDNEDVDSKAHEKASSFIWSYCDADGNVIVDDKGVAVKKMTLDTKMVKGIYKNTPDYIDKVVTIEGIEVAPAHHIDHEVNDETAVYNNYVAGDSASSTGMSFYAHAESNEYKLFKLNSAAGFGLYTTETIAEKTHSKILTTATESFTAIYKVGNTEFVDKSNVAIKVYEADHLRFTKDPSEVEYKRTYYAYETFDYKPLAVQACCPDGIEGFSKPFTVSSDMKWYDGSKFDADNTSRVECLYPETTGVVGIYNNNPNLIVRTPIEVVEEKINVQRITNLAQLDENDSYIITGYYFKDDKAYTAALSATASNHAKKFFEFDFETTDSITKGVLESQLNIKYNEAGYFEITALVDGKLFYIGFGSSGAVLKETCEKCCQIQIEIDFEGKTVLSGVYVDGSGKETEKCLWLGASGNEPTYKSTKTPEESSYLMIYKVVNE